MLLWRDNIAENFLFVLHHLYWSVKQSEETGNMCDERTMGRKSSTSVLTEEVVGVIREALTKSLRKSLQCLSQQRVFDR